ncbi:MAG: 3-oxoacyl-ACP reductase FabG [Chromatiales bacterium]|jgi:3-oxoacyl-[acyl-carrier protein] reductase|nr:3-oxoacyl-ACP reductase FabG [Chromatiales bacterium]
MSSVDTPVALVTGAGKNIGRAIAERLARDGAAVVVNGRTDEAAVQEVVASIKEAGGRAVGVMADVSQPDGAAKLVSRTVCAFGGLDVIVSNAGLRRQTPLLEMDFAEWREILSVALDGAFLLAKAAVPHLIERGGGAFIGLSGVSTHSGTINRAHVSASKSGLEGLMRAMSREFAPHGITCNCVAPGAIDTVRGVSAGTLPPAATVANIPLGRKGTPDEIAAAVALLASPEGRYITGQTIHVNGGVYLT